MSYKYYYLSRPPGIGCQPSGFIEKEAWTPKQYPPEFPRGAWGWVEYEERLLMRDSWRSDLFPVDPVEQLCYRAWQEDKSSERAIRFLGWYFKLLRHTLEELKMDRDWWAEMILDYSITLEQVLEILEN